MSLIMFFVGLWLGGIIGIVVMCILQLSGKESEREWKEKCLNKCSKGDLD